MNAPFSPPEALGDHHETDSFVCGEPALDHWLRRRARENQESAQAARRGLDRGDGSADLAASRESVVRELYKSGASRTYVVSEGRVVIAYYALASGAIAQAAVPGRFRRNMPDPIPVVVLARLAVHRNYQGRGIGRALFRDAARRVAHAADTIGIRGIVVHALSEKAREFYIGLGFDSCPSEAMTLVVTLSDIRAALGSS